MTNDEMTRALSPDGVDWSRSIGPGVPMMYRFREIRLERTGWHALVAVFLGKALLESDTFNISRREDRVRLIKQAHGKLGEVGGTAYPLSMMEYDFQVACLRTPDVWEEQQVKIEEFSPDDVVRPVTFVLKPFILEGGGTILFAPPGAGKSYLLQTWAICVSQGIVTIWPCEQRPVLYINLERSNSFLRNREAALRNALGWAAATNVLYLDGRGLSLKGIERKARAVLVKMDRPVVFLDSISRAGGASLNDDDTANGVIDLLNRLSPTWVAIGHTTKAEMGKAEHVFGSVHFIAGCDLEVKVATERGEKKLGLSLTIVKGNEVGFFPPTYLAFEFDQPDMPVTNIRKASQQEFSDLAAIEESREPLRKRIQRLLQDGRKTVGELHEEMANAKYDTIKHEVARNAGEKGQRLYSEATEGRKTYFGNQEVRRIPPPLP